MPVIKEKDLFSQPRYFDKEAADRVVSFMKNLTHTKGEWAGQPFGLQPWQEHEIIRPLFGTVWADGTRCFRNAYISTGRKNGKTEMGAGLALYFLFGENEPGGEIYSCAGDKPQASLVFDAALTMVLRDKYLRKKCRITESRKQIYYPPSDSTYKVIAPEAKTKHGFNASAVIYDELHVAKNRELWDVLKTSMKSRRQPMMIALTTAGFDLKTICGQQYQMAKQVKKGTIHNPTYFSFIAESDTDKDDWENPKTWKKANPNLGVTIRERDIQAELAEAKAQPELENTFRRLTLNQWTGSESAWIQPEVWKASAGTINENALLKKTCFGGMDLASVEDIAGLVLEFPFYKETIDPDTKEKKQELECVKMLCRFWIPEESAHARTLKDGIPYELWVKQGFIKATEGNVIDYEVIRADILELADIYDLKELAYDPWNATQLATQLETNGIKVIPMRQGIPTLSAPTKEFNRIVRLGKMHHANNPVMTWMISNVRIRQDSNKNIKPDKKKSAEKIDGVICAVMATDRITRTGNTTDSIYETRGVGGV